MGMNRRPMMRKTGRAVLAVMIGCHAGSRCCLNAVSKDERRGNQLQRSNASVKWWVTSWFLAFLFIVIAFGSCLIGHGDTEFSWKQKQQDERELFISSVKIRTKRNMTSEPSASHWLMIHSIRRTQMPSIGLWIMQSNNWHFDFKHLGISLSEK